MRINQVINNRIKLLIIAILCLFLIMIFIKNIYLIHVFILVLQTITLAVSYRFITLSGQWTFAHYTMMGWGAYTTAILSKTIGLPVWVSWPVGIFVTGIIALMLGLIVVKTRHVYYFFATWAFAFVVENTWTKLVIPFGGFDGIPGIPSFSYWFDSEIKAYYLILIISILSVGVLYALEKGKFGKIIICIDENEDLAKSIGINIFKYRMTTFIIGSSFAGLIGGFHAHYEGFIAPGDFGWIPNWFIVIYIISGGTRTIFGAMIGTIIFVPIIQLLASYKEYIMLGMGIYTIFVILVAPDGIEGLIWRLRNPGKKGVVRALR